MSTLTLVHTLISIVALLAGGPLLLAFARGQPRPSLATATIALLVLTSASGYLFPFTRILPSHIVGAISLVVLAIAIGARWGTQLAGGWRRRYAIALSVAIYLDAFVFLVQAFLKIPALKAIAPTQQSPGFVVSQGVLLVAFVFIGRFAARGFARG